METSVLTFDQISFFVFVFVFDEGKVAFFYIFAVFSWIAEAQLWCVLRDASVKELWMVHQ